VEDTKGSMKIMRKSRQETETFEKLDTKTQALLRNTKNKRTRGKGMRQDAKGTRACTWRRPRGSCD